MFANIRLRWLPISHIFLMCWIASCPAYSQSTTLSIAYGLENYNFESVLADFSKETGVDVSVYPFKNNELKAELLQRSEVQQLPDVVIVPSDFVGIDEIKFSPIPTSLLSKDLSEKALVSAQINKINYGIPIIAGNHLLFMYNKAIIAKPASTWDDLIAQQSSLPEGTKLINWSYHEMYWFIPFIGAFNEFPLKDGKLNFQTDGMKKALKWYRNLSDNKIVDSSCGYVCSIDTFTRGNLAYTVNGSWSLNLMNEALGDDLGIALFPTYKSRIMRPYFSSHIIAYPDNSLTGEKADALEQLGRFFQKYSVQRKLWEEMRSLPTHRKVMAEILNNKDKQLEIVIAQLELSEPMPNDKEMAIVWEAMLKGVNRYQADVLDLDKTTEYMHYIAEKSIDNEHQAIKNE
jgi:maltose-binding protein MalE